MLLVYWWTIDLCLFKKRSLSSDQNNVLNWFRSNEDEAELFNVILPHIRVPILSSIDLVNYSYDEINVAVQQNEMF